MHCNIMEGIPLHRLLDISKKTIFLIQIYKWDSRVMLSYDIPNKYNNVWKYVKADFYLQPMNIFIV